MYTICGGTTLSLLLLTLSGICSHPIRERSITPPAQELALAESFKHKPVECTPARQAERSSTHDIACLLADLKLFISQLVSLACMPHHYSYINVLDVIMNSYTMHGYAEPSFLQG